MRILNAAFINKLKEGIYLPLLKTVINDSSLDLQIRKGYINIYFRGNSILKLDSAENISINKKFLKGTGISLSKLSSASDVAQYLDNLPIIKNNVTKVKSERPTMEIEYEQFLIRSNNLNANVNSDIFITDRQYANIKSKSRFDLSGFLWKQPGRKRNQTVPMVFIEVKYSLNSDIKDLNKQIGKYYKVVKKDISDIAKETQDLKDLKIELGLIKQPTDRLSALSKLRISNEIEDTIFIIALIDYNPHSKLFDPLELKKLPFSNNVKIFNCGFAVWSKELITI